MSATFLRSTSRDDVIFPTVLAFCQAMEREVGERSFFLNEATVTRRAQPNGRALSIILDHPKGELYGYVFISRAWGDPSPRDALMNGVRGEIISRKAA